MTTGVSLLTLPSLSMPVRPDDDVDNEDEDDDTKARPSSGASILLIDYAINDAFELQVQNSRLSVDVYKNAKRTLKPLNQSEAVYLQVVAATEAMVRFLLNGARVRSALLVVEGSCWRSTRNTVDAHASVARHYGVPFFDFAATLRNGIRPVQSNYMQQLSAWSGGPMRSMMRRDNTICDACIRTKKLGCESSEAEPQLQPTSIVLVETPNAKEAEPVVMDTSMFASPSLLQTPIAPPRPPPLDVLTRRILESPSVTPMIDERSIAAQAVEVDSEGMSTPQQIARRLAWIKHHVANRNLPAAYALGWNGAWRTHDGGTIRTQETPVASTNGVAMLQAFTTPTQTFRI